MQIKLYLNEKKERNSKKAAIMVYITHKSSRLRLSTGISILISSWDSKKNKIKSSIAGSVEYNARLQDIVNELNMTFATEFIKNKEVSIEELKPAFAKILNPNIVEEALENELENEPKSFFDHYCDFMEDCRKSKGNAIIKAYKTTFNHLKAYQDKRKENLDFIGINKAFYEDLVYYLSKEWNLNNNSIGKDIKNIKVFMRWALDKELTDNIAFLKFKVIEEDGFSVALTIEEIIRIEELDLSNDPRQDRVRDLFLFMVYSSLRVSDLFNLKPENILWEKGIIKIRELKTKGEQIIALLPQLKKILMKYPDSFLPKVTSQEINRVIKHIAREAKIDDPCQIVTFSGQKRIEKTLKKWELITCHTGRRTNITLSLKKGIPADLVRRQSGHKSMKHFEKYIKMTEEDVANIIGKAWE